MKAQPPFNKPLAKAQFCARTAAVVRATRYQHETKTFQRVITHTAPGYPFPRTSRWQRCVGSPMHGDRSGRPRQKHTFGSGELLSSAGRPHRIERTLGNGSIRWCCPAEADEQAEGTSPNWAAFDSPPGSGFQNTCRRVTESCYQLPIHQESFMERLHCADEGVGG